MLADAGGCGMDGGQSGRPGERGDMSISSEEFFDELKRRGHEPLLRNATGTLRFDVVDGKRTARWFLTVKKGDLTVSRQGSGADCIVRGDKALVEGIWAGDVNAFAAVLRGEIDVEGDLEMMVLFQRLLPGPAASQRASELAGSRS
jgi:putative sterol carrier protein